jgi:anaerobic ribonucleoside-triphosphate reductase activating protein
MAGLHSELKVKIDVEELARTLSAVEDAEGVTISGGEPFLQPGPLAVFLRNVRNRRDYGAIIYTGFRYEELTERRENEPDVLELLGMTDILIDGRYVAALDDGKAYRGSSNQRIIQLSERYSSVFEEYYSSPRRRTEMTFTRNGTVLVGVPSKDGLAAWMRMQKAGVI